MFTLVTDRSKYFRVRRGQSAADIEKVFGIPVTGEVFSGKIIALEHARYKCYRAAVGDTYRTIALKFGVDEGELKEVNGNVPVYPTRKLFVPCK